MPRTKNQRADLAEFVGGEFADTQGVLDCWVFTGGVAIPVDDWHPDSNPAHMMLVLEALEKIARIQITIGVDSNIAGKVNIHLERKRRKVRHFIKLSTGGETLGDAVCSAAENVME